MKTRTAVIIAALGVLMSLCVGIFGGAAAGYYISKSSPLQISNLTLPPGVQSTQPRRPRQTLPQQIQPNQTQPDQTQPEQNQPQQTLPRLPDRFKGLGLGGALVMEVSTDSPAGKAGLQASDMILAVDSQNVDDQHPLTALIQTKKPGDSVELKVRRGSDTRTVTVTLGANPENSDSAFLGVRIAAMPSLTIPGDKTN